MKKFFYIICLLGFNCLNSQRVVEKVWADSNIHFITVDAKDCFEVSIKTIENNEITLKAIVEGEYRNDIDIQMVQEGDRLIIGSAYDPVFELPNDKLSTLKSVSITMEIGLPRNKSVKLIGNSCSVSVQGIFDNLDIVVADRPCDLRVEAKNTTVHTQSGDIFLSCKMGVVNAGTTYGKIYRELIPKGSSHFFLTSTTGDIHLIKTD